MESTTIDETLLSGSEGATLFVDERTLAGTPAPVAASTVVKESHIFRSRAARDNGGSFLNSQSLVVGELDSDRSSSDRSSLGLLPSNCLLEIENDLLREGSICLMTSALMADTQAVVSSSSVNSKKKNQLMDSQSSREYTSDTHEFLTTVKKCPQAAATERDAGRYAPQALFQSVKEVDESTLDNSSASQRDSKMQNGDKWDSAEAQKNADSGMGQATFQSNQTSNGSGSVLSGLGTEISHASGGDTRKQCTEMWDSGETQKNADSGTAQTTIAGGQSSNGTRISHASGGDTRKQNTRMWASGEIQKNADSGMAQAPLAGTQPSNGIGVVLSGLGIQIRHSRVVDSFATEELNLAPNEDEEADHSVYQPELEPEDIEELVANFSDFVESSDEDVSADDDYAKQVEFRIGAGTKEDGSSQPKNLLSRMDGPFKVPLPLLTPAKPPNRMCFGNQPSSRTATPCKEPELQATFGDSLQFCFSGSTSEWGPSIDFGSSTHIGETLNLEKDSRLVDQANQKNTFTSDSAEPWQPQVPSFGELPVNGGNRISEVFASSDHPFGDFPNNATCEIFASSEHTFGDIFLSKDNNTEQMCHNPFGNFPEEVAGQKFGDEEFMLDADAAAAMLAEDEKLFNSDHLSGNEVLNLTQVSMRGFDQTFMNMSIGTYMATGSVEFGSLTSRNRRPDIGMPVTSPPADKYSGPLLSRDEIFRSPDGNTIKQTTDGGHDCFKNALFSLDDTDTSVVLENQQQKKSSIDRPQETSPYDLSPFLVANSQKHMQDDYDKASSKAETSSSSLQAPLDIFPVPRPETSTKINTGELKSASACQQHPQALSAATMEKLPPPKSHGPGEEDHDHTLVQAEMSMCKLEDETHNSTSDQVTFSSIYNLIERSDTSLGNLGELFLSEYNKKVKEKQAAKQSKKTTDNKSSEKGQEAEKSVARSITHDHDIATASSSVLVTSQRKGESQNPVQTSTVAGTDVSELEIQPSKNTVNTTEAFEKKPVNINKDSTSVLPVSQSSTDHHRHLERQQVQIISNASKPRIHPSQSKVDNEKVEHKIDAGVTSTYVKNVHKEGYSRLPSTGPQQVTASAKSFKPSELNVSNKSIPPEKIDGQQRNLRGPDSKHVSALPAQQIQHNTRHSVSVQHNTLHSVSEKSIDDESSLESITINSTFSEMARSRKSTVPHPKTLPARPSFLQEKVNQLSVVRLQEVRPALDNLHQLLNATKNSTALGDVSDVTQFHTLVQDSSSRSLLENTELHNKLYVSSTPQTAHRPGRYKFVNMTQLTEKTILPIVTPQAAIEILEVPEIVCMPEVCCVNLSLQTSFVVKNLLDKGVRCLLTIGEVTFNGHRINSNHCPFELKGQVVLSPVSSQIVQVMFRPKNQGEYTVNVEICSQNMTNPQENRTYILHLSGYSEEPALQISAVNDEIDFGEMVWGSSACRSINIKNVGRATIPLRCSIFRKESALCNFTFYPENVTDVSSISLTTRPAKVGTVYSLSLPGKKDGQKILMETINIYCCAKESQNLALRYKENAEKFQAILTICVDVPIEDVLPLCKVKLQATAGMYKLHVDRDTLPITAAPGKTGHGTIQIINSGNIAMPVNITLEPWREHFTISTASVFVPSGGNCPVHVTFTPQPARGEQGDNIVNLMLQNKLSQSYVSVIGKIKAAKTNIRCSVNAVSFGGVDLGQVQKQKAVFYVDNDDDVRVCVRNQGTAFKLLNDDGSFVDSREISAKKGQKYDVFVLFSPSEVKGYSADFTIQVLNANRYTIPLAGYGGRSQVLIEKVQQNDSRDLSLDIGHLHSEQTVVRKFTVRNVGVRSCYIKASLYDTSRQLFESSHAAVIPAALILSANETCELFLTMTPSKKEAEMCMFERAVVAILKLTWGDEVARQHFILSPGNQSQKLVHDFDIPLSSTQKELVHSEMKSLQPPEDSYSVLKKGMSMSRIALYGLPLESETSAVVTTTRAETYVSRPVSYQRPVLTPVDANIKTVDCNKKMWALNPTEIHFAGGDLKVKDFIQVINFSANEIQLSVEFDKKYISVVPSKCVVPPMNTTLLGVSNNLTSFSMKESTAYLTMIKVNCLQQTQLVKVNIKGASDRPSPKPSLRPSAGRVSSLSTPVVTVTQAPVHTSKSTSLGHDKGTVPRQQSGQFSDQVGHNPPSSTEDREGRSERIQGLDVTTVVTTEAGTRRDEVYFFTNVSTEPLIWKLAPFASPYVTLPDNIHSLFRVDYEVFRLSPLSGVLQQYETEKVHIKFSPECEGSYNQAWCVHDTADNQGSFHRFTIYAKASVSSSLRSGPSEQGIIPQGLSPTHFSKSPRGRHTQKSLRTSRLSPPTNVNTAEASKPLGKGSSVVHNSKLESRMVRCGVHRTGNSTASPTLITTRSSSDVQRPTSALTPGVAWVPVTHPDEALYRPLPVTSHTSSGSPVYSRAVTRGTIGSSSSVTQDTEASLVASDSLKSVAIQESSSPVDGSSFRSENGTQLTFNLVRNVIKFPKLDSGDCGIVKISVQNNSDEEIQVVVERAPKPPFLIKHYSFKVRKNKMVKFPVTFKPKHVATFEDVVIFKDTHTGNTVTATLLAECVNTPADTSSHAAFSHSCPGFTVIISCMAKHLYGR